MFNFGKKREVTTDELAVEEAISRSISTILPSKEDFKKILLSGKKLKIYLGADATGSQLHLGHATNLIFLERLRKLGHDIVILFGDFTAMIGDPTGKDIARVQLTEDQVAENIKSWKDQVGKVINLGTSNAPEFVKNSKWLSKLNFKDLVKLSSNFTVQQMIERDMFEKRLQEHKPIYLHEFLYPLMQGYDSVALNVDAEVGGNDQTFNMLAGRILQKSYNHKEKFVIATTLLVNPKTGKKLMSKSEGGYIALNDSYTDMFGKVMALPDEVLVSMFIDCTYVSMEEIEQIKQQLVSGVNPRDIKVRLAKEIVTMYHSKEQADQAEKNFIKAFSKGGVPDEIQTLNIPNGTLLKDVLVKEGIVTSNADWKRLIEGNAVSHAGTNEVITDLYAKTEKDVTLRIGKKRFVKISVK